MKRTVGDSDAMRRQNRGLVLDALRRHSPRSRTQLAGETGLSHATITAISADMIRQGILEDHRETQSDAHARGRPAVSISFRREAGYVILFDMTVNHAQISLVDYGGTSIDRVEMALGVESFADRGPANFLIERIAQMKARNPAAAARTLRAAVSVQGILERDESGLKWSPKRHLAGHNLVAEVGERCGMPIALYKRGRLLAEGTRHTFPQLGAARVATVFVGSTVSMGLSMAQDEGDPTLAPGADLATEFGHMVHQPDGALCRCGARGCIEAYAADYGVLRSAFGVPADTAPAPGVPAEMFQDLIDKARLGDRYVNHAFGVAGKVLGFGLNRLMTVFDPSHIVLVGPGSTAFEYMREAFEAALEASLVARTQGVPEIMVHGDERELVHKGLVAKALGDIDQNLFAAMPTRGGSLEITQ